MRNSTPQMNDPDQSSAAASRPPHPDGERKKSNSENTQPSFFGRLRNLLTSRSDSLRTELQSALQTESQADSVSFTDGERTMLSNVLKLSEMRVEDVMVPRADIVAVEMSDSLGTALNVLREAAHSRVPVYDENLDNIGGMIHIKDLVERLSEPVEKPNGSPLRLLSADLKRQIKNQDLQRRVLFVPPSMPVSDLLQSMQATRVHMAIVVDEYGGTDGLVTIEDLLEAVVGDIEDEHDDEDTALVKKERENVFQADARASLEELQETIGADFDPGELAEEAETLGGLVFSLIDRVPVKGEVITELKGFDFEIMQADPRRIRRVKIIRRARGIRRRPKSRADLAGRSQSTDAVAQVPASQANPVAQPTRQDETAS